jgi:hypothetical protein
VKAGRISSSLPLNYRISPVICWIPFVHANDPNPHTPGARSGQETSGLSNLRADQNSLEPKHSRLVRSPQLIKSGLTPDLMMIEQS